MGIFDKAKDLGEKAKKLAEDNSEKINEAAQKAGDFVDEKTHGKYSEKIDKAQDFVKDKTEGSGPSTPTS